jgi:hypothetical protein
MKARWLAMCLSLLVAAALAGAPAADAFAKPAAKAAKKSAKKPVKSFKAKSSPKAKAKDSANKALAKASPVGPKAMTVDKLPGALKTAHVCAMPKASVEFNSERYAKTTLFFVSCTAAPGALTPFAVYVAKDAKAKDAKLVTFEGLGPDGSPSKLDMLYSATPVREAYSKPGDETPQQQVDKETPWIMGAWKPDDRPGVCAVAAQWKLNGNTAELYLWEEAKECPNGQLPKYERKADKNPPQLVGRSETR